MTPEIREHCAKALEEMAAVMDMHPNPITVNLPTGIATMSPAGILKDKARQWRDPSYETLIDRWSKKEAA